MLIERYVNAEILKPFAAGLGLLAIIFVAFSTAIKLTDAAAGELASSAVAELIFLNTLISLEVLIPTTLYLAILFAVGRLYRDSEMAALAAAGVGEGRLLSAAFKLGLLASIMVGLLSVYVRPWAYARSYQLEQETISKFEISSIQPGTFINLEASGYVLYSAAVDAKEQLLRRVFLHLDDPERTQIISAQAARILDMDEEGSRSVEFFDGYSYLLDRHGNRDVNMRFNTFLVHFPEEERITKFRRKAVPTARLRESDNPKDIAEFQWRLTTPLATILLSLLAVPLSRAQPRQSRMGSFVVAVLAYMLLFSSSGIVRTWLEDGKLAPSPGLILAYVPAALLLAMLLARPGLALRGRRR